MTFLRPAIGLDLDGPIVDLYPQLAIELEHWFGIKTDPSTWRSYRLEQLGIPQGELQPFLESFFSDWPSYESAIPVEGAAEGLRQLRFLGFVVEIVTARPVALRAATKKWLATAGLLAHEVHHVPRGAKAKCAADRDHVAFLEDNPWEAANLADVTQAFLFHRSYNASSQLRGARRVRSWREFVGEVAQLPIEDVPSQT